MSETYTTAQIAEHKSEEAGLWIIVDGSVYDVTSFLADHPGGPKILKRSAGKDASKQFWKVRNPHAPDTERGRGMGSKGMCADEVY